MKASNDAEMLELLVEASKKMAVRRQEKASKPEAERQAIVERYRKHREHEQEIINRRLALPVIPSREEANREGCRIPALKLAPVGWTADIIKLVGELPEDMDPRWVEAYRLFPAFMADYGHRYFSTFNTHPKVVLEAWKSALTPSDNQLKQGKYVMPSELRYIVEGFANPAKGQPQWFNVSPMRNYIRYLMTGDGTVREAVEQAAQESPFHSNGKIAFHQTVRPSSAASMKTTKDTDWLPVAGYPHAFPDALLSASEKWVINRVVNHRFQTDEAFTSQKARWLAGVMVQAVSYQIRQGGSRPNRESILDLGFRFSTGFIARTTGEVITKRSVL